MKQIQIIIIQVQDGPLHCQQEANHLREPLQEGVRCQEGVLPVPRAEGEERDGDVQQETDLETQQPLGQTASGESAEG